MLKVNESISYRVSEKFRRLEKRANLPESDGYITTTVVSDIRLCGATRASE